MLYALASCAATCVSVAVMERAVRKKVMKLYNPDMRIVNNAVQTTPLKRRNADEINTSGLESRPTIGRKTTRKKKNPPIIRTTDPTCIHCINDFNNIFLIIGFSCRFFRFDHQLASVINAKARVDGQKIGFSMRANNTGTKKHTDTMAEGQSVKHADCPSPFSVFLCSSRCDVTPLAYHQWG